MAGRNLIYFASDVHLGLRVGDPAEREERFLNFLKGIPRESTSDLYLMGDIWDFWYEYHDVIPREGIRVVAQIVDLLDAGVNVHYFTGNHDIWCFSFFQNLGVDVCTGPKEAILGGKTFYLAHGDRLGRTAKGYRFMMSIFHSKVAQALFSTLHPRIAFGFASGWSTDNRTKHSGYIFKRETDPLYAYAAQYAATHKVHGFVFGHLHNAVDLQMESGARFIVLKDWMEGGAPHAVFDTNTASFTITQ